MALARLIYASRASIAFSNEQLRALTCTAAQKNSARDISGVLVHTGNSFLQMLEGEESAVVSLFSKIAVDPRHHDVQQLSLRPILTRSFFGWGMSCLHDTHSLRSNTAKIATLLDRLVTAPCLEELGDRACILLDEMKAEITECTDLAGIRKAA